MSLRPFTSTSTPPGLLGGAFLALDNAPQRSLHIKIHPRPRSLGESQQILHLLRHYGEVEVYRHLKYDSSAPAPNSLLVVYKHTASAAKALQEGKISFRYAANNDTNASVLNHADTSSKKAQADSETDALPVYSHTAPFPRPGELIIRPAGLLHLPFIQRQRYYWPVNSGREGGGGGTPGEGILDRLPAGLAGLRDFDLMAREVRFREREIESRLYDARIKKKGWERLEDLWEKGRRKREGR